VPQGAGFMPDISPTRMTSSYPAVGDLKRRKLRLFFKGPHSLKSVEWLGADASFANVCLAGFLNDSFAVKLCEKLGQKAEIKHPKKMTAAQAVNPMPGVPSEVRSLQRQHSTIAILPLITIITRWLVTAWYGDLKTAGSLLGCQACVNCCVGMVPLVMVWVCSVLFLHAFYIVNVDCSVKKNEVGLQITPCRSTVVQFRAPYVPPLCARDDLNSAVSALLCDDSESLD
jgi:hypothetical protein